MRRSSSLFIVLVLFVALNMIPWTLRLTQHRGTSRASSIIKPAIRDSKLLLVEEAAERDAGGGRYRLIHREGDTQTIAQLIQAVNYSRHRAGKACEQLAENVTIDMEDPFRIGVVSEVVGRNSSSTQQLASSQSGTVDRSVQKFAYVLMVSNHKYIDGAIVVADSLRSHSTLVQQGQCDVVLLVPDKIHSVVLELLSFVFTRVLIVRSLDQFSPKSYYKTTFDKIYLYSLHAYRSVIFFDADSLIIGDPDKLFQKVSAVHPLTAVGSNDYFQTALLIVKPSREVFLDLYIEYRYGSFGYNQWRARDGILFRNCLMTMHDNIGHPVHSVFHFYGYIKPWFNKDLAYKHTKEKLVFDKQYLIWWERYERLHTQYFADIAIRDRKKDAPDYQYGETALQKKRAKGFLPMGISNFEELADVSPREYMWLQRFSGGSEYHRPTFRKVAEMRNVPLRLPDDVRIVVSSIASASCEEVCNKEVRPVAGGGDGSRWVCVDKLLQHSSLNDCTYVYKGRLGPESCATCAYNFDSRAAPFVKGKWSPGNSNRSYSGVAVGIQVVGGAECYMNFLHEPLTMPACNATAPAGARRVCPCRWE